MIKGYTLAILFLSVVAVGTLLSSVPSRVEADQDPATIMAIVNIVKRLNAIEAKLKIKVPENQVIELADKP